MPEHIGRRASTVEIGSEQLADDLRLGLAEMFRAWNGLSHRQELGKDPSARTLQPGAEADEVMCGAARSSDIPGLVPLINFLGQWYPRGAAQALFEEIRCSFYEGRAWSVYKGRYPANSAAD